MNRSKQIRQIYVTKIQSERRRRNSRSVGTDQFTHLEPYRRQTKNPRAPRIQTAKIPPMTPPMRDPFEGAVTGSERKIPDIMILLGEVGEFN